ncbi:NAD(P)-dependent alcohol dehydrogenase [Anaerotruncus colihominis]|uniref:NAD(P)-dependent alcohol dehydrogenase n=1 Tax=Anaerotruncus colihominis TaxID=169435 RepID=UPI0018AC56C8|nr:NAD(P)-dependent alcohol dehydrogenase [Anaerotruncus colihominis]
MVNKAAFVMEKRKIEIMDSPMPEMKPGYVKVKVGYCGVCGSDVHHFLNLEPDFWPQCYPFIIGHEFAGTVVEVAGDVKDLKVGDRVCVEPGTFCGKCEWCRKGRYNLCKNMEFLSAPPVRGAMREYITHPAELCFKLPDHVSTMEGALVEPLAVGMNAVVRSGIHVGDSAVVLGTGCIGLVTIMSLKAAGITDITAVDLYDIRLEKALEVGATRAINTAGKDTVAEVLKYYDGIGPDFVFETAGSHHTAEAAVYICKKGGVIMQVGNVVGETSLNLQKMCDKELTFMTNFRYLNIYPTCVEAIAAGRINVKDIVSRVYPLDDAMQAFEDCVNKRQSMVKAVLKISDD